MKNTLGNLGIAALLAATVAWPADAATFRYSTTGDILGLDPHINNEGPTNAMKDNLYEGLVSRHWDLTVRPALATEWTQVNPTTTRFKLRAGVTFHDGTPFTADDVVFSFDRIRGDQSDMKTYVTGVKEVRKIDDLTVEMVTEAPDPVLIQNLSLFHIMSKAWAQKHNTLLPLRARCARLLLSLVELYGASRPHGYLITLKLSQEEFADMLGRSRQSVNKELRTLESEGLIKTNYSQFIIVDLPTLQAVAEGR